jgi:hypothetical protein
LNLPISCASRLSRIRQDIGWQVMLSIQLYWDDHLVVAKSTWSTSPDIHSVGNQCMPQS